MKKLILSIFITSLLFSQLLSLAIAKAEILYPVEVSSESTKVRISKVKIQNSNEQLLLSGLVKRRSYNSTVLPGHISYEVNDAHGKLIHRGDVNYSPSLSLRRWKSGSRFNLVLPNNLPKDSRIKLAWRQGK